MSKSFLQFLESKNREDMQISKINEAFKESDIDKAHALILSILKKEVNGKTIRMPGMVDTTIDGKKAQTVTFVNWKADNHINMMVDFNYLMSGSSMVVYSIDFFDGAQAEDLLFGDESKAETKLTIYTTGQSVAYFLPIVIEVVNSGKFDITKKKASEMTNGVFKESVYIGAQQYVVSEGLDSNVLEDAFHIRLGHVRRDNGQSFVWESEAEDIKRKVRAAEVESWKTKNNSPEEREASIQLDRDYREICRAIKGGATTLGDLELALGRKISVAYNTDQSIKDAEKRVEEEKKRKTPEQAFKEMQGYVKMVIKGLQPGVILCGAPGIGKTYRVLQQLKASGYKDGSNLHIIKGKCTTRSLYIDLYTFSHKGEIILIDDADSLIGPKAPEDTINILKAALDSTADTDGRKISYKVAGKLEDEEGNPIPKEFYYNGSVIVITNYSVGQLDTAIRGRVFTQSLDFTTEQLIQLVKELMPAISPSKLKPKAKMKALDYLIELDKNGENIVISIRSFEACAKIFQVCDDDADLTNEDAESMIKEQLNNQFKKTGKKF